MTTKAKRVTPRAIETFYLRADASRMKRWPQCTEILRCLRCGSTWSMLMDGVVSPKCLTVTVMPVSSENVDELGTGVAWFGIDDCKLCAKDRKEPDWDALRADIDKLPNPQLRTDLAARLENRRRRFRHG